MRVSWLPWIMLLSCMASAHGQELSGSPRFPGVVVDADGHPIAGARVLVWSFPAGSPEQQRPVTAPGEVLVADDSGAFALPPSSERRLLAAEAPGLAATFDLCLDPGAAPRHILRLELLPEVAWTGTVFTAGADGAARPVAGARVCLHSRRGGTAGTLTLDAGVTRVDRALPDGFTGTSGLVTARLPRAPCFVIVYPEGLNAWSGTVDPDEPSRVAIEPLLAVSGRVVDPAGKPIPGCAIGDSRGPFSDASGNFSAALAHENGTATLRLRAPGFAQVIRELQVSAGAVTELRVPLQPLPPLRGRIVDARGEPVSAYVDLLRQRQADGTWGPTEAAWDQTWTATDTDGTWQLPVPAAGEYLLSVDNANDVNGRQFAMHPGEPPLLVQLGDDERGAIDLGVIARDALTGAVLDDATHIEVLTCYGETLQGGWGALGTSVPHPGFSPGVGVKGVPFGEFRLRVAARGHLVHESRRDGTAAGVSKLTVDLPSARIVWLRLVGKDGQPLAGARATLLDARGAPVLLILGPRTIAAEFVTDEHGEACVDGMPLGYVTIVVGDDLDMDRVSRGTPRARLADLRLGRLPPRTVDEPSEDRWVIPIIPTASKPSDR
jgi:Carboxypeptidase regulatory-like domain